jgi:hypothetical protein
MAAFSGSIEALGGRELSGAPSYWNGAPGTIYLKPTNGALGTLKIDNAGTPSWDWGTPVTNDGPFELATLMIGGQVAADIQFPLSFGELSATGIGGRVRVPAGSVHGDVLFSGTNSMILSGIGILGRLTVSNGFSLAVSEALLADSIRLVAGGNLSAVPQSPLNITVTDQLTIDVASLVDATGMGHPGGRQGDPNAVHGFGQGGGWGSSAQSGGGGAGYGGFGGDSAPSTNRMFGRVYGLFYNPSELGSGGGRGGFYDARGNGGPGGGAVRLKVRSLVLNGEIRANGMMQDGTGGGGGSGGSIRIECESLMGAGVIRANGGSGRGGYGGGGGRVAVFYNAIDGFSGRIEALGGRELSGAPSYWNGGAGTVFLKTVTGALGTLMIDNAGTPTADWGTPIFAQDILRLHAWSISGSARVWTTNSVRVATGDPNQFSNLISNNFLQVRGLFVGSNWVYGDFIDLAISASSGRVRVTMFGEPTKPYVLQGSLDFLNWTPVVTNVPIGSSFEFLDPEAASLSRRFYRVFKPSQ